MRIREVYVRYRKSHVPIEKGESLQSSKQVFEAFRDQFLEPVEVFRVLHLDGKNRALCYEEVGRGILTSCLVHPREVFSTAVRIRSAGILALHNHPLCGAPHNILQAIRHSHRKTQRSPSV